jgi:hypothetical protein
MRLIAFLKEFYDNLMHMVKVVFYASCAMLFVAGLLMAYANTPLNLAMSTILIPSVIAIIIAAYLAHHSLKRGWV